MEPNSWSEWIYAIFQCLAAILTAVIAISGYWKDSKSSVPKTKKLANLSISLVILALIVSLVLIISQTLKDIEDEITQSEDKKVEKKRFDDLNLIAQQLRVDNQVLTNSIKNSRDTLLNEATRKSIVASNELRESTKRIERSIFGSDKLIYISAILSDKNSYIFSVQNPYMGKHYNLTIVVEDYKIIENCAAKQTNIGLFLDVDCARKATKSLSDKNMMNMATELPDLIVERMGDNIAKYRFYISTRNMEYVEEYYANKDNESFRLFRYDKTRNKKIILTTIATNNFKVDWEKEFAIPPFYYITSVK